MDNFVSLNNSSESLEKTISLVFTSMATDEKFYSAKNQKVFYGHNLPKGLLDINVSGTIGFYIDNFSNCDWSPIHTKGELWNNRNKYIQHLILNKHISPRIANRLLNDRILYEYVMCKLPVDYLFPEYYKTLLVKTKNFFPFINFMKLDLEKNYREIFNFLPKNKSCYSIYGLEGNGKIGHYYMNLSIPEEYYIRRLYHLYNDLEREISLSGNVGILLANIDYLMRNEEYILGYRERKNHYRANREQALFSMSPTDKIIEPKNIIYNSNYEGISSLLSEEEMSNIVVAKVFKKVAKELNL